MPAELLTRYPHQLSGGMCQRVLIAMAFASKPKLVIADEPTTALDVTIQARVVRLIAEMQERDDTAVLFITHDLRLAAQVCHDILVLYAGRAAEYGPARDVFGAPGHPYTRCLQLANPAMRERRGLYALPERMPGLRAYNAMTGCAFAPRCPLAIDAVHAGAAAFGRGRAPRMSRRASARRAPARSRRRPSLRSRRRPQRRSSLKRPRSPSASPRAGCSASPNSPRCSNVSFALHENEFVGIVGESGSGKSTLARLIVGLETPSEGRIAIAGRDDRRQRGSGRRIAAATSRWCSRTRSRRSIRAAASPAS